MVKPGVLAALLARPVVSHRELDREEGSAKKDKLLECSILISFCSTNPLQNLGTDPLQLTEWPISDRINWVRGMLECEQGWRQTESCSLSLK
jgi:hypothetical protein